MGDRYPIPAETVRVEDEVKRSRFVTTLGAAATVDEAKAFVAGVRAEFPDASHNCWAYLVGTPGSTGQVGMSDDGEPHGTAGRPMLNVLVHSGLGDLVVVVTRYFGGTKLGKGGLVRAYSGGVQHALEAVPRAEHVALVTLRVTFDYASVTAFKRLIPDFEAEVVREAYGAVADYVLRLPEGRAEGLREAVSELTNGAARFSETSVDPPEDYNL